MKFAETYKTGGKSAEIFKDVVFIYNFSLLFVQALREYS